MLLKEPGRGPAGPVCDMRISTGLHQQRIDVRPFIKYSLVQGRVAARIGGVQLCALLKQRQNRLDAGRIAVMDRV